MSDTRERLDKLLDQKFDQVACVCFFDDQAVLHPPIVFTPVVIGHRMEGEQGAHGLVVGEFDSSWDAVLLVEETAYEQGRADGLRDASKEGVWHEEGRKAGYLRGFALGLEVGYMETVASLLMLGKEEEGASDSQTRQGKRLATLIETARAVPNENAPTVDFDGKVRDLRALLKLCAPPAGSFRRTASGPDPSLRW